MVFIFTICRVQGLFDPDCGREVIDLTNDIIDLTMDEDNEEEEEEEVQEDEPEEEQTDEPRPDTVQSEMDRMHDDVLLQINNEMIDAAIEEARIEQERAAFDEEEEIVGGILEQQRREREDAMVEAYEEEMQRREREDEMVETYEEEKQRRERIQQVVAEHLQQLESLRVAEERRLAMQETVEDIQNKIRAYIGVPSTAAVDIRKELPLMAEENFHNDDQIQAASQELADDVMDVDFVFEQPPPRAGWSPLNSDHYTAMGSPKLTEDQLKRFNDNLFYQFKINVLDHTNYCSVSYDPNNVDAMWEKFASDYMHRFHMTAIIRRNDAAHARNGDI